DSRVLLLRDNCEHLGVAVAEMAAAVLRSCPSLMILATSREPLRVDGEITYRVPSLSVPSEREPTPIEALSAYDAVVLFVERATRARPNFAVTVDNAGAVTEICRRLDGIPLAIELAAARVRTLPAETIARGLHDRFRLLGGGPRTVTPRQQTLLASVDWSHALLSDAEKVLCRRLSAFAGGFTLDSAEAVAPGDPLGA